ncbi:hypothetical protein NQ317_015172, partial [Molorchus minor]
MGTETLPAGSVPSTGATKETITTTTTSNQKEVLSLYVILRSIQAKGRVKTYILLYALSKHQLGISNKYWQFNVSKPFTSDHILYNLVSDKNVSKLLKIWGCLIKGTNSSTDKGVDIL